MKSLVSATHCRPVDDFCYPMQQSRYLGHASQPSPSFPSDLSLWTAAEGMPVREEESAINNGARTLHQSSASRATRKIPMLLHQPSFWANGSMQGVPSPTCRLLSGFHLQYRAARLSEAALSLCFSFLFPIISSDIGLRSNSNLGHHRPLPHAQSRNHLIGNVMRLSPREPRQARRCGR